MTCYQYMLFFKRENFYQRYDIKDMSYQLIPFIKKFIINIPKTLLSVYIVLFLIRK